MSQTCTFHNGSQPDNITHCLVCGHPISVVTTDLTAYAAEGPFHSAAPHWHSKTSHERGANNN